MPARTIRKPTRAKKRAANPPGRLRAYHAKRDLAASGEPAGSRRAAAATRAVHRYVIQKHDATRLHYDFRLEMEGVLRSWAVPKGLPVEPGERALAVEVEDHPIEYGTFEGTIPPGNYGAGTVMLWDRGSYTVADGDPAEAYRRGKIHLALAGEKCVGEWTLVRMRPREGERQTTWLVIKNRGPRPRAPLSGKARERSVLTGRTLAEIARGDTAAAGGETGEHEHAAPVARAQTTRKESSAPRRRAGGKAAKGEPARFIPVMKALSVDRVPAGPWRLEVKLDGYRALAVINDGEVELWSRNHKSLTADYPEIVAALRGLNCTNAVVDGEIVALDAEGRSRFQLLQGRGLPGSRPTIVYYVFDLLHRDGTSLLERPVEERQKALAGLMEGVGDTVRVSPVFEIAPDELLAAVRQQGLEGIIAKRPGSVYEPDKRSGAWLKCKVHGEQEFVIGGYTPPKASRPYFGAILVGTYENGKLMYAGKVGSGYNHALLKSLYQEFQRRRVDACPFANLPESRRSRFGTGMTAGEMRKVTWVKPELVCQVRFTEWTDDGMLRHPVFLGLRHDKAPTEVVRETAGGGR